MAWTARTKDEEREYFDKPDVLDKKVTELAKMIKASKHFTCFTGAGISTSAGIPDFRSGLNTVLDTGAGAWAKSAAIQKGVDVTPKKKLKRVSTLNAIPTQTHMALVELNNKNILKYLISQNCDGLHRRSGYNPKCISELHGNTNLEFCKKCGKQYLRDYSVRDRSNHVHTHTTKRLCKSTQCIKKKNKLNDTIINFGESLNDYSWDPAELNANKSDCCLVLGSSLTVSPACNLPEMIGENHNFCIVNLQKTPMDHLCNVRIYAKCDDVMKLLMSKLGLSIPAWSLKRYIDVDINIQKKEISIYGIDSDGTPYDILSEIKLNCNGKIYTKKGRCLDGNLFKKCKLKKNNNNINDIQISLGFMGHYNEPNLVIDLKKYLIKNVNQHKFVLNLSYNPYDGKWTVGKQGNDNDNDPQNDIDIDIDNKQNDQQLNDDNDIQVIPAINPDISSLNINNNIESLFVGNLHKIIQQKHKNGNGHEWILFISSSNKKLIATKTVEKVIYKLHPTFNPSTIECDNSPFYLKRIGWGVFKIDIQIIFKNKYKRDNLNVTHMLDFRKPVTIKDINHQIDNNNNNGNDQNNNIDTITHSDNYDDFYTQ